MRAGELRHRVKLQSRSGGRDTLGAQVNSWTDVTTTFWAAIGPLTGHEQFTADAMHSEVSHMVTTRYQAVFADPKAVAAMRLLYGTRIFSIHAVINTEERNAEVRLLCSEGPGEGG